MDSSAIQRRLSNIRGVAPKTVTCVWNTKTFTGIRGDLKQDLKFSDYGYQTGCEFLVIVPKDDIGATLPQVHDDIKVDTIDKRIVAPVTEDSVGASIILQIGNERA